MIIRLIELLDKKQYHGNSTETGINYIQNHELADYLVANNVVVLPCKVGDSCYPLPNYKRKGIVERKISRITYTKRNIIIGYYENDGQYRPPLRTRTLGKDVFLNKDEAEQAVNKRR